MSTRRGAPQDNLIFGSLAFAEAPHVTTPTIHNAPQHTAATAMPVAANKMTSVMSTPSRRRLTPVPP